MCSVTFGSVETRAHSFDDRPQGSSSILNSRTQKRALDLRHQRATVSIVHAGALEYAAQGVWKHRGSSCRNWNGISRARHWKRRNCSADVRMPSPGPADEDGRSGRSGRSLMKDWRWLGSAPRRMFRGSPQSRIFVHGAGTLTRLYMAVDAAAGASRASGVSAPRSNVAPIGAGGGQQHASIAGRCRGR